MERCRFGHFVMWGRRFLCQQGPCRDREVGSCRCELERHVARDHFGQTAARGKMIRSAIRVRAMRVM